MYASTGICVIIYIVAPYMDMYTQWNYLYTHEVKRSTRTQYNLYKI